MLSIEKSNGLDLREKTDALWKKVNANTYPVPVTVTRINSQRALRSESDQTIMRDGNYVTVHKNGLYRVHRR